jgi:hypothetical protein
VKSIASAIQYSPVNKVEEERWGFEIFKPTGTPYAYVTDWPGVGPGWGLPWERVEEVARFKNVSDDLSKLTVDETYATLARQMKFQWHNVFVQAEKIWGVDKAMQLARAIGTECGLRGWTSVQNHFGKNVEPGPMAWYQDIAHMLYGPDTHAYTWFDDKKAVCSRPRCAFRPFADMPGNIKYCVDFDYAYIEAYMGVDQKLLTFMAPHVGNDGCGNCGGKCVHIWTYDPEEASRIDQKYKDILPESIKKLLKARGMKF